MTQEPGIAIVAGCMLSPQMATPSRTIDLHKHSTEESREVSLKNTFEDLPKKRLENHLDVSMSK